MRLLSISAASVIAALLFPLHLEADPDRKPHPDFQGPPPKGAFRAEAADLSELIKNVNPTFVWNERDMMWIATNERGDPIVTLDRAYLYQRGNGELRWVLLNDKVEIPDQWKWNIFIARGVAKLRQSKPTSDHGSGEYVIVLSTHPRWGTIYEIGWQELTSRGTNRAEHERRLYLLKTIEGRWIFIGEGEGVDSAKTGCGHMFNESTCRVTWTGNVDSPVRIDFTTQNDESISDEASGLRSGRPSQPPRRPLRIYHETVLEGPFPATLQPITERPYVLAESADTVEKIAFHLSAWSSASRDDEFSSQERRRHVWLAALQRLNPQLPQGEIPEGTRIHILTYKEEWDLFESGGDNMDPEASLKNVEDLVDGIVPVKVEEMTELIATAPASAAHNFACEMSPDGTWVAVLVPALDYRDYRVLLWNIADKSTIPIAAGDKHGEWPIFPSDIQWAPDSRHIYIRMRYQYDSVDIWFLFSLPERQFAPRALSAIDFMRKNREHVHQIVSGEEVLTKGNPRWVEIDGRWVLDKDFKFPQLRSWENPHLKRPQPTSHYIPVKTGSCSLYCSGEHWPRRGSDEPSLSIGYVLRGGKTLATVRTATPYQSPHGVFIYQEGDLIYYVLHHLDRWSVNFGRRTFVLLYGDSLFVTKGERESALLWLYDSPQRTK